MERIKLGIIGLNRLGLWYIDTLQQFVPEAELIAASSRGLEELDKVEKEFGIKQNYVDYRDMLSLHELDAVIICSRVNMRVRHAMEAMDKGLHVLVASPLAYNVADCEKLIQKDERHPNQLGVVGMMHRFSMKFQQTRKAIEEGKIGELLGVQVLIEDDKTSMAEYEDAASQSGSIYLDLGEPYFDAIRFLTGDDFQNAMALTYSQDNNNQNKHVTELAMASGMLKSGALYHFTFIRGKTKQYSNRILIQGSKGTLQLDLAKWSLQLKQMESSHNLAGESYFSLYQQTLIKQLKSFVKAMRQSGKSPVPFKEAREAIKVSVALSKSIALNELVELL